jgi:uncharacterized protein (DUF1684 family)
MNARPPRSIGRIARLAALAAACLVLGAAAPAPPRNAPGPMKLSTTFADSLRQAIVKDRADTEEWLKTSSTSYLAAIQRRDFDDRMTLMVGSAAGADVRIDNEEVRPRHLRAMVVGDSFRVETLDPAATFRVRDSLMTSATVPPTTITIGRFKLRLSHQRFPALIVFDPQSPRFREYKGISYYPVDFGYRFELSLTPNPRPDTVVIVSTRGNQRHALRVGWFDFTVAGKPARLEVTRLLEPGVGEKDFSIFFTDATTGKETYPVGRYLEPVPVAGGKYVLDFNVAYNPACAYSDHYNCPIPSKANKLAVAIRAGEKDSHYLH